MSYYAAEIVNQILRKGGLFASLAVLVVGISFLHTTPTQAQTNLQVLSCDGVQGSSISITSPESDSTTDNATVTIEGTVSQANQIEVYVDSVMNDILPINFGQMEFSTTVSLAQGTHTIQLVAVDLCQTLSASDSFIITYTPAANPGNGGDTPTEVDGGNQPEAPPAAQPIENTPAGVIVRNLVIEPLKKIAEFLDIAPSNPEALNTSLENGQRFALGASGATVLIGTEAWTTMLTKSLGRITPNITLSPERIKLLRRSLRGLGVILIALMFLL